MGYQPTGRPPGRPRKTDAAALLAGDPKRTPKPATPHAKARKPGVSQVVPVVAEPSPVVIIANECSKWCGILQGARCVGPHEPDPRPVALRFVENLTHTKGEWAGKPFNPRGWQVDILSSLFGTLQDDERRQYRTCYVEIPRKNGKTEVAAALALYMPIADSEQGAEVYGAAGDLEQASLCYSVAAQMCATTRATTTAQEVSSS